MASYFAAQLKDMFFVLVERVTGYGGWGEDQDAAGTKESKMTSAGQASPTDEEEVPVVQNIQIRARSGDPFVSGGSKPQVE
ncbi:hypothetical protein BAE44_0016660 [Dichanthelium oligosanthes]|uniref:Uncharacterized protein n=1 Tax=Dichanthelium oligosanthes TaxID=888268 RepID=A0A1E5VAZ0_9POAL|nr:hypothetical protein BAE44_0016660 [Dichanthelium oligosanthes]